jgi:hypothetical protein
MFSNVIGPILLAWFHFKFWWNIFGEKYNKIKIAIYKQAVKAVKYDKQKSAKGLYSFSRRTYLKS